MIKHIVGGIVVVWLFAVVVAGLAYLISSPPNFDFALFVTVTGAGLGAIHA